jgi:hypothetical protein
MTEMAGLGNNLTMGMALPSRRNGQESRLARHSARQACAWQSTTRGNAEAALTLLLQLSATSIAFRGGGSIFFF